MKQFLLRVISVFKLYMKTVMKRLQTFSAGVFNSKVAHNMVYNERRADIMLITIELPKGKSKEAIDLALNLNLTYCGSFHKGKKVVHILSDDDGQNKCEGETNGSNN